MLRFLRRLRSRPSALLLGLLLLSVCARPMLQIATGVHTSGHPQASVPAELHAHADEHAHDTHDGDEGDSIWHALAHAAHCCSHVPLIDLDAPLALTARGTAAAPPWRATSHANAPQRPELRPPISA